MIQNVIKALAKSVLISLGLTDAASPTGIHKKTLGSGHHTSHNRPSSSASHNNTILII